MTADLIDVAVRGWTEPPDAKPRKPPRKQHTSNGRYLVVDTETVTTPDQSLTFGCWRYCRRNPAGELVCLDEGLFYADDLPERDPAGYATLQAYADTRLAEVAGRPARLRVISRAEFAETVLFRAAYKARATVVGFNLPFDLSRLALAAWTARDGCSFSFSLWQHDGAHHRFRPVVQVRHMTRHYSFIRFTRRADPDRVDLIPEGSPDGEPDGKYAFSGHFLDLRTLGFALTNLGFTLASAAEHFGCPHHKTTPGGHGVITTDYIDYCRNDVHVTAELCERMLTEFEKHPIDLPPTRAFSPAAIAKAYLRAMNIAPILDRQPDFPREILGASMDAFYGGRAECRIRRLHVPVELVDFTSMYPTVDALMGVWDLLVAARIEVVDCTAEVQQLLDTMTVEDCLRHETWRHLVGLCWIHPDDDILPVRGDYIGNGTYTIGLQHYTADITHTYAIPDLVAAKILTGKPPQIDRAVRLVPSADQQPGLRPTRLAGLVDVDPTTEDFFRAVIRRRLPYKKAGKDHLDDCHCPPCTMSLFLKVLANSGSYGIFAELNPETLSNRKRAHLNLWTAEEEARPITVSKPEKPGVYCFPPMAACITAAARLMLAVLEALVTRAGAPWAFCDTDSMAILATKDGGLIPNIGLNTVSYDQVQAIRDAFTGLNPYDTSGSILDTKTRAGCYAISAKRYTLTLDDPE